MGFCKKKKASHVGLMLSFVIFITFIIVILTSLYPLTRTKEDKQFVLDYVKSDLVNNLTVELETITLKITGAKTNHPETCFSFETLLANTDTRKEIVKFISLSGDFEILDSGVDGMSVYVNKESANDDFYKVFLSDVFVGGTFSQSNCDKLKYNEYEIGSVRQEDYVYEGNIEKLAEYSKVNYDKFKDEFDIPQFTEIHFSFNNGDKSYWGGKEIGNNIPKVNIFSENIPITFFNSSADVSSGFINIRIW